MGTVFLIPDGRRPIGCGVTPSSSVAGSSRTAGRIRRHKGTGPEPYDFRRPTKLSREHVRTLQIAYETFARQYATLLTTTLRVVSQVSLISIEQLTYEEYIDSLESPTIMGMVSLEPLPGTTILEFSLGVAMVSIDHMLGGPGGAQPVRALSDIETPLLTGLINRILNELRVALEPITEVRPNLDTIEYSPQFLQAGVASDAVIVASFDMRVGNEECVATLSIPFGTIFPKLHGDQNHAPLSAAQQASRELAKRRVAENVSNAPLEVSVRFLPVLMSPADLVGLQPGDVVPLGHPVNAPLSVMSSGITFAHAVPGSQGARLACLVVAPPAEEARP